MVGLAERPLNLREWLCECIQPPGDRCQLARAGYCGDAATLEHEAHILRSASATVGAQEMSALSGQIEEAARAGQLAEIGGWLATLHELLPRIEQALTQADSLKGTKSAGGLQAQSPVDLATCCRTGPERTACVGSNWPTKMSHRFAVSLSGECPV